MRRERATMILLAACLAFAPAGRAHADDAALAAQRAHVQAIEALMATSGDEPLKQFGDDRFVPAYRDSFPPGQLVAHLRAIRTTLTNSRGPAVQPGELGVVHMKFKLAAGSTTLRFVMQQVAPYQIMAFDLVGANTGEPKPDVKPITWETLKARLDEEEKAGFSATVYVMRDGKVVLYRGYGLAERDLLIKNGKNTIYAIASTPIEFTRAAVLKLEQTGKLKTSDSISKYFPDAPADKKNITIDQLMAGTSGLANFRPIHGTSADPDLTWIDRDTALKRIFTEPLLFKPGQSKAQSHTAWVLLAALVEKVSGQSYIDFVTEQLFKPAKMTSTTLHEGLRKTSDRTIAIGYGGQTVGHDNKPKYWGRTSWLVMGSGGMVSTVGDLASFITSVHDGTLLNSKQAKKYGAEAGMSATGDDRGFYCLHAEHNKDMVVVLSNAHSGPGDLQSAVGEALAKMVVGK